MAFRSLISSSSLKSCLSNGSALMMRHLSSKIFVRGLSDGANDDSLKSSFDSFGNVAEAKVIPDRETGRSRVFGNEHATKKKMDFSFVHVLLKNKNKTFVTVTDARGNKKTGASAGSLTERKGRSRRSRYAAEATAEHVGRTVRNMGLKAVVMKVKGYTFFRKKKKVILSWREGFLGKGVGAQSSQIKYIHDVTQIPHNGCRLPKKRRI